MVLTSFSDANILNIFSGGSLLPGHTVYHNYLSNKRSQSLEKAIDLLLSLREIYMTEGGIQRPL